jgi:hypothetical protein
MTSRTPRRASGEAVPLVPPSEPLAPVVAEEGNPATASVMLDNAVAGPKRPGGRTAEGGEARSGSGLLGTNLVAEKMSERDLENAIRAILRDLPQVLAFHAFDSRRSAEGFPDWIFVGRGVIFAELKTATGRLTPAQERWLERLTLAGEQACVWRPDHLLSGHIARRLVGLAGFPVAGRVAG